MLLRARVWNRNVIPLSLVSTLNGPAHASWFFLTRPIYPSLLFFLAANCLQSSLLQWRTFYEEKNYDTIEYNRINPWNRTIASKIFAYPSRISLRNTTQRNKLFPLPHSFSPKNCPTINWFKTDSEEEKRKKGINFKTSTILKYSKGLKNTYSQWAKSKAKGESFVFAWIEDRDGRRHVLQIFHR